MTVTRKDFDETQKLIYLDALSYILNIEKKTNVRKTEYLKSQAFEMGFEVEKLKFKTSKKNADIISELNSISNIRIRRYILREMVMLAIADHELTDKEVDSIYAISCNVGVCEDKIDDFFLWAAKGVEWQIEGQKLVEEDL